MTKEHDPLEAELGSLQPRPISAELRRRIAKQFDEPLPIPHGPAWNWIRAGSVVAACLVVIALRWNGDRNGIPELGPFAIQPSITVSDDDPEPTLLTYQRAAGISSDDLQKLLDRRALVTSTDKFACVRVSILTRFDSTLDTLLGDNSCDSSRFSPSPSPFSQCPSMLLNNPIPN